ncbi:MAG: hypothetical protein QM292_01060 [Bacteroidota bacterium]|nr:hypothetical protein [Bacteroidota bacterium]
MKKLTIIFMVLISLLMGEILKAQNAGIGSSSFTPDASAGLEIRFTDKGLLIPRVALTSTSSASPITSPATSLLVYNTATAGDVTPGFYYWNGSAWVRFASGSSVINGSGTATRVAFWTGTNTLSSNTNLYWDNTNSRLGVGTSAPSAKLEIRGTADLTLRNDQTLSNSGNDLAVINLGDAYSGSQARILVERGAAGSGGDNPTDISFWNTPDGSVTLTERMRIMYNGNVGIGTTYPTAKLHVVAPASQHIAYFYQTYNNYMYIKDTSATELLYAYKSQLTSKGDGQSTIYGYRTRDSQNDGTGYGRSSSNGAVKGYNFWGDLYSYGVGGFNWNDYNRSGGVLGAQYAGSYWASLGYKNSGGTTYGAYWGNNSGSGTGYSATGSAMAGVGAGGYGDMLGLWSRGEVMGAIFAGELFSAYNLGNTYTSGTQVELVKTDNEKTPAYTMTSTEIKIYADGLGHLSGNEIFINYDNNFKKLLGETAPIVTITPIGKSADLYIKSISKDGFIVACDTPQDIEFTWISVGTRIDNVESQKVPEELTDINFDSNLVDFMFNENIKERNAKAMWWDGNKIQFGTLPDFFHQADREAKQAELEKIKQMEEKNNNINTEKKSE